MKQTITAVITVLMVLAVFSCETPKTYLSEDTYYIDSEDGSDDNSGLVPDSAWASIDKLNSVVFAPGSKILFKSGQIFRGSLSPSSGSAGKVVAYGSYDGDVKPVIQNSVDLGSPSSWKDTGNKIWKAMASFNFDVGNIIFDGNTCGMRRWSASELKTQNDFYFDSFWKTLRVKSSQNPANLYRTIEAALTQHIVDQSNVSYTTFSGLHLRYGGAHGFGGGGTRGITIQNCEISFIGGGFLHYDAGEGVRYGNGVEFWGDAEGNTVESCYIHDIYDTGLTNQNHSTSVEQKNITYKNNIIENCALASFEFWNRPKTSSMSNIVFENNTSVNPGGGWGVQRPDLHGSHVSVFGNESSLDSIIIKNNIFFGGNMIYFFDQGTWTSSEILADFNCLYPVEDGAYDYLCVVWDEKSLDSSVTYSAGELEALQTASGRETASASLNPQFEDDNYPYTLSTGSAFTGIGASGF